MQIKLLQKQLKLLQRERAIQKKVEAGDLISSKIAIKIYKSLMNVTTE